MRPLVILLSVPCHASDQALRRSGSTFFYLFKIKMEMKNEIVKNVMIASIKHLSVYFKLHYSVKLVDNMNLTEEKVTFEVS